MKDPIFIFGPHKSGTTLLLQLFDGHPELFSIPFETRFMSHIGFPISYRGKRAYYTPLTFAEMKEELAQAMSRLNQKEGFFENETEETTLVGKIDVEKFRKLMDKEVNSIAGLGKLFFESVYTVLTGKSWDGSKRVVEKSLEHMEFGPYFKKIYPEAKFIRIIRNPYSNFVSYRRLIQKKKKAFPRINHPAISLYNSYNNYFKNKLFLDENYLVIKYEDLVTNPEQEMRKVSEFLGITFNECLLEPTKFGSTWLGNSSRGIKFKGISTVNLDLWKKEITHLERFYVANAYSDILREFGYEKLPVPSKLGFMKPIWGESLKVYLLNRSLYPNFFTPVKRIERSK